MLLPFRLSTRQVRHQVVCLLSLTIVCSTFSPSVAGQTQSLERLLPVKVNSKVIVLNAPKISVSAWEKSEVAIVASAPTQVTEDEITIQSKDDRLEIICHAAPDKAITLTLRLPSKAALEWKTYGHKVEIREPAGTINLNASKTAIHLDVPTPAKVDFQEAGGLAPVAQSGALPGGAVPGSGPPHITVTARGAQILVSNGPLRRSDPPASVATRAADSSFVVPRTTVPAFVAPRVTGPSSVAARAVAGKDGSMGQALRRSNPQLLRTEDGGTLDPAAKKPAEEETIKLETDLVNLNISVTDRAGRAIAGLTRKNFEVYEEGEAQKISFFAPEQAPFNLVLLLDLSGSVKGKISLIKAAALHFLDVIGPQDSVALITFTSDVTVVSPLTRDREQLREAIRNLQTPVGGTAFYDALGYALVETLGRVKGQRNAVIAITDGEDNSAVSTAQRQLPGGVAINLPRQRGGSYLTFEQLLEGVMEADALIYPIHIENENQFDPGGVMAALAAQGAQIHLPPAAAATELARKQMWELAEASGGRFFSAARLEDLQGLYDQVAAELRTVYSLAYSPENLARDGKFRRIRVKLNREGAAIRTRRGYYAR